MSDEEHASSGEESADEQNDIGKRHRKEQKELTARIQALKKSVPKGDNKKKKTVAAEIEKLTADLSEKQRKELEAWKASTAAAPTAARPAAAAAATAAASDQSGEGDTAAAANDTQEQSDEPAKSTRAQRRREKKDTESQERTRRIAEAKPQGPTEGEREMLQIAAQLMPLSLRIEQIPSDGHCLFRAVGLQLAPPMAVEELRQRVARHMLAHPADFSPFVIPDDSTPLEEYFKSHCNLIATTSAWGGQPELKAVAELLHRSVRVFHATGVVSFGDGTDTAINLTYHRHQYRMGEHYNAAVPATGEPDDS